MIFGSVCSGIEAASVAWHPLGWRAAFVSEIDKFASSVLAHHYGKGKPRRAELYVAGGDKVAFESWIADQRGTKVAA